MSETTFKEAWGVLQKHAQTLRNQSEPNIDDLLGIVTESVQAYKVCQSRVEAVERALEEALKGSGAERRVEPTPAGRAPARPEADDDDVPF
jgi:exodeoxyribonuclease VII small subunit